MFKKIVPYLLILNLFFSGSHAQEVVTGLPSQIQIIEKNSGSLRTKGISADMIPLPFFDDFSGSSIFPDPSHWSDDFAFINNTYSDRQITTGVATLDAIDNYGRLYESAATTVFRADQLTSQPIDLAYPASDNIWLSFWYQPGGLGDQPEPNDSLTLQFLAPEEGIWYSVWKAEGSDQPDFKPVIIRIEDARYLMEGFRFRFVNYASLTPNISDPAMTGNCDHWNLDYVLLDRNRHEADTLFRDVAFTNGLRSLLKTHESMPWNQFRQASLQEMGSFIPISYRNNDNIIRNVTRNFRIRDVYRNQQSHSFSAGATNIDPQTNVDYNASLIYTFNTTGSDSALFNITAWLITDDFDPKANDTIRYEQRFSNYFAFDDGSAEGGYGINGLGSRNAMAAYRFKSFIRDTLRAVRICFNDSYMNSNRRSFDLMVWDDNLGSPGNVIYSLEEVMVEQGPRINGFYTYLLPDGVMVDDVFYVGWRQRSETFLNAGYDVNTPHGNRQFYWLNGSWNQSQVSGSVMIRPVVGEPLKTTSIDPVPEEGENTFRIRIWPNPASGFINLGYDESIMPVNASITVIDLQGREQMNVKLASRIDISFLPAGIYIVIPRLNGRPAAHYRLVKTR
ncbi:MAG: T9SS type A sorting domain-containing protein [Bacteroidales bacterium]|nr:T9SS type A sorting domain-containing protein [Bacteroidales bacterium]